jgi:hypothetical protein
MTEKEFSNYVQARFEYIKLQMAIDFGSLSLDESIFPEGGEEQKSSPLNLSEEILWHKILNNMQAVYGYNLSGNKSVNIKKLTYDLIKSLILIEAFESENLKSLIDDSPKTDEIN